MVAVTGEIPGPEVNAIVGMLYRGAWLIDHGRAGELPANLAPDGMSYGLGPEPIDHEAFTRWAEARQDNSERRTRHIITNIQLEALPDGRIQGTAAVMVWAAEGSSEPSLSFIGDYEDIYIRDDRGDWLIHERRLVPMVPWDR